MLFLTIPGERTPLSSSILLPGHQGPPRGGELEVEVHGVVVVEEVQLAPVGTVSREVARVVAGNHQRLTGGCKRNKDEKQKTKKMWMSGTPLPLPLDSTALLHYIYTSSRLHPRSCHFSVNPRCRRTSVRTQHHSHPREKPD